MGFSTWSTSVVTLSPWYSILRGWMKRTVCFIFAVLAHFSSHMTNIEHLGESHDQYRTLGGVTWQKHCQSFPLYSIRPHGNGILVLIMSHKYSSTDSNPHRYVCTKPYLCLSELNAHLAWIMLVVHDFADTLTSAVSYWLAYDDQIMFFEMGKVYMHG